jgi:glycosyltransferase involved in cell wall biosynthesis
MASPRVSVIVTCYNLGQYLDEAVDSVLAQTFQDFEILVVDDGSTDPETVRLLDDYRRPKTRVVRSPNGGLPAAKNLGVARTTGAYVCTLDADDRLAPEMLRKSVAALDDDPSIAFVSHWLRYFGDESGEWTPASCGFPALLDMNTVNGAALVRRAAYEAVGGNDDNFRDGYEDWDFWISLVERGFPGRILPEVLYEYRRRAGSMSRNYLKAPGHPELYRRLVSKHADSYRLHLGGLLVRREEDIGRLRGQIHDLDLEHHAWMAPELAKRRDDVAGLRRKASGGGSGGAREHLYLRSALDEARAEVAALRSSMSWRITAPLRAVYGQLLRLTRPQAGR